ncbi:OmpH family outer membrane protein [Lewinella sp. 4G2]|uniref:OmpH family outer membrane protein n=1 Tax=Lewinella sp. 4G2 TaxID=1803372 RepID=UPI0007B4803C|nr:OmpH family outer membrane protein [Lewinella sp. 4G2]OAV44329.1 hypothetical protein A3850_007405 [Lewinella sp. 4G2]
MTRFVSTLLPAVLFVTLATLTSCQPQENAASASTTTDAASHQGLNLVFIRLDSLQNGYTALATELDRLETNANAAQENIQKEVVALENEVRKLQNQAQQGLLTPNKIKSEQQRIAQKEQQIMQQRDIALGSIQEDQMRLQTEFGIKVKDILRELRDEKGYDMIFNEGGGSGLLMGADAMDITPLVLERLNAMEDTTEADAEATEE